MTSLLSSSSFRRLKSESSSRSYVAFFDLWCTDAKLILSRQSFEAKKKKNSCTVRVDAQNDEYIRYMVIIITIWSLLLLLLLLLYFTMSTCTSIRSYLAFSHHH